MRALAGSLLACSLLVGNAQAGAPSPIEIADGRGRHGSETDVSPWKASPPVLRAIDAARRHWPAAGVDYEEDVRVLSTATGAFTRPDVEQRIVLYRMSIYPRAFPLKGLAVLEGDRLVRHFAFAGLAHDVRALPDLDGDGRNELALANSFGMGGQWTWGVSLASYGGEGLADLGHATLYNEMCGALDPEHWGGPTAERIWVVPGSGMMTQHYRRASCESETWEPVGEPEPFTLTPAEGKTFTEISVE